ncbi:MAG: pitrilysin family protein [Candidatus Margulisiibacteriota bacterium]
MIITEKLPNGITFILEQVPHLRSVAVGITVKAGSMWETTEENGVSHFLEHLAFKGTKKRDALAISEEIDAIGGRLNAHTGRDYTTYYAVVLDTHLNIAIDLLSDIFLNPCYAPNDINTERTVVHEEIKLYEDTPDELIHDLFAKDVYQDHPLGSSILGSRKSITALTREQILNYREKLYIPKHTIISIAGNFDPEQAILLIRDTFSNMTGQTKLEPLSKPGFNNGTQVYHKRSSQNHLCWGCPGVGYTDKRRYQLSVLHNILGGTMSSRLFQEVREKRGLAYSIYSYPVLFKNDGLLIVYAGTASSKTEEVIRLILQEVDRLKSTPVNSDELQKAKENLKGNMVLSLESSNSKMSWNTKSYHCYGRVVSVDETFNNIDAVTAEQIQKLALDLFHDNLQALTIIGQVGKKDQKELEGLLSI